MTSTMPSHTAFTSRRYVRGILYSLEGELERVDREAGHDYLPMDVFIDSQTIRRHFRESSVRDRLTRTLSGSD